jgi:hypothetical protein
MSDAAAAFDALAAEFFPVWFRFHPEAAAVAGVSGFTGRLTPQGDDEVAALESWLGALVVALEELDYRSLDPGRRIDLRLMFGAARAEHQGLLERDWRHRDPLRFLPIEGLYRAALDAPDSDREGLVALLAGLPDYLRLAVGQLRTLPELVCPLLVDAAVKETDRARCYLRELVASPWLRHQTGCRLSRIAGLADAASTALTAYGEALRSEITPRAAAAAGCGERHLGLLLRHRQFLDPDAQRARAVLIAAIERTAAELDERSARLGTTAAGARAHLDGRVVPAAARLETYRTEAQRLRGLLVEAALVSPPDVPLHVRERGACPRPSRMASDYLAGDDAGSLYLGASRDEPLAALRARARRGTWVGAHLLTFAGGAQARRLPRRLCAGASAELAWGLYLDDRLAELSYLEPEDWLWALLSRQHALRLGLLDLDLHLGCADAASLAAVGRGDLVALLRRPGDALAGVLGWDALTRARKLGETAAPAGFDQRAFHDRLVAEGRIPVPLALESALGAERWSEIATPWLADVRSMDQANG